MKKLIMMAALATVVSVPAAMADQSNANWFTKLDTNKDGIVSKAEYDNATAQKFALLDVNRDGKLTSAEAAADRKVKKAPVQNEQKQPQR